MSIVLGLMVAGIFIGYFLRRNEKILRINEKLVSGAIYLLLFFLGIMVGTNKQVLNHFDTLGMQALIITLGSVSGSVLAAWGIFHFFFNTEKKTHEE